LRAFFFACGPSFLLAAMAGFLGLKLGHDDSRCIAL